MTGTLRSAGLPLGKSITAAGLADGLPLVWMLHRVCGKKVVEALCDDIGQIRSQVVSQAQLMDHTRLQVSTVDGITATMTMIPEFVRNRIRVAFSDANNEVSRTLSVQPNIHEVTLDHLLVAAMNKVPSTIFPGSSIALAIDTHWIGGRPLFLGRWEIADIALVAVLRRNGYLVWRKVALLQSKRLYSRDVEVVELDEYDYLVGIGRLIDSTDKQVPLFRQRGFSFDGNSIYKELRTNSEQVKHIEDYSREHKMPIYYSLYNPLEVPMSGITPIAEGEHHDSVNKVGCRIARSNEVHQVLATAMGNPTFDQVNRITDRKELRGWRIEQFVADEFLVCHEGRKIEDTEDRDMEALLYDRTAPISAAIVITVDLPPDYETIAD